MALKVCEGCGIRYAPKVQHQRFHNEACRKRASRRTSAEESVDRLPVGSGPVTEATIAELEAAGLLDRAAAQGVIAIARRLDEAGVGPSAATLNREHRTALAALLATVPPPPDRLDSIGDRRLRAV